MVTPTDWLHPPPPWTALFCWAGTLAGNWKRGGKILNFKMAAACEEFPSESLLQELISSFHREWQGLFAALNVKESLAIHSGTKWLRDNSSQLQKNFISPHWPDLLRSLCLLFPVVLNKDVIVFQPKFACFTLKTQRNMLCFIVYHSDRIPVDDIKVFESINANL